MVRVLRKKPMVQKQTKRRVRRSVLLSQRYRESILVSGSVSGRLTSKVNVCVRLPCHLVCQFGKYYEVGRFLLVTSIIFHFRFALVIS